MTSHREPAFSVAAGRERGLGRGAMAGPRFFAPYYGVRQAGADTEEPDRRAELRRRCGQFAARMHPRHFFSGGTALGLRGAPLPEQWVPEVHVSAYRPDSAPRVAGVAGHRLQTRTPAFTVVTGLRTENAARAWVQASRQWEPDDLIAAGDFLILRRRPLATVEQLRAEAAAYGSRALVRLVDELRDGCESPRETRLRLLEARAGLPEPLFNHNLYDEHGRFIARVDQAYVQFRVSVEYDGRQHATDPRQFAYDADRWDRIRRAGWDHVRILKHHMAGDGAPAVEKIQYALRRAGWRPGA